MKKIITAIICVFILRPLTAQNIRITINSPTPYQLSDSVLSIKVSIQSTYLLTSVTASINGRQTSLSYNQQDPLYRYYGGTLSLSGFSQDTLTLQVFANDLQNNRDSATVKFIYDQLPVLAVTAPLNLSVARPLLPIKVRCVNKDSSTIKVYGIMGYADTVYAGSFIDSVNTIADFSRGEGGLVVMQYYVTDKRGQRNGGYGGQIFVESSPYLTKVFEGNDQIIDFNYNNALISGNGKVANSPPVHPSRIVDIQTKDSVIIPDDVILTLQNAFLTPLGAVFTSSGMSVIDSIMDWNSGALYFLGTSSGAGSLQAKDNYAIWPGNIISGGTWTPTGLAYRDLAAKVTALISAPNQTINNGGTNAVLSDGTVAYAATPSTTGNFNVYAYRNGNTQKITNDMTTNNSYISTDGKNFLYEHMTGSGGNNYLHLFDGQKDTLLADLGTASLPFDIHKIYQADNNFFVFPKKDTFGLTQLWLKDSVGKYAKVTSFGSLSGFDPAVQLDLLNAKGDFIFYATDWRKSGWSYYPKRRRFFASKGQIQEVCSGFPNNGSPELCRTFYRDSSWYISIGRDLFRINVDIAPNTVTNSSVIVKKDSVYPFSNAQFVANFTGPGQLIYLMIDSLPTKGTLKLNGVPVATNAVIVRADLNQLSYVPNPGFTGIDSFAWNGSNGINYTASSGLVRINVSSLSVPQQPILSGISNHYCNSQGIQKIKINNLPDTSNGTHVQVNLDSTSLSIAGDSSFSFNVDSLSATLHTVSVVFSNLLGTLSTIDSFYVTQAITPVVSLSVTDSIVTSGSLPITLTANAVAGGGNSPQYLFASDRAFQNILQQNGTGNTLTIQPSTLNTGSNWFYVQMTTSDSCYTIQTGIDSIQIIRMVTTDPIDPDYPKQVISIYPNPFDHQLSISGLQASKMYRITLTSADRGQIFSQRAANTEQWQTTQLIVTKGIYVLRLYDETKNRVIGVMKLVAK